MITMFLLKLKLKDLGFFVYPSCFSARQPNFLVLTMDDKVYILDIYNIDYVLLDGSMSQAQSHIANQRAKRKAIAKHGYYYQ